MIYLASVFTGRDVVSYLGRHHQLGIIDGDSGYWELISGPGNAIFSNINGLNTSVDVDAYGEYIFSYKGCGTTLNSSVNMTPLAPDLTGPDVVSCLDSFDLSAQVVFFTST